ncbi:hypothetical protein BDN67DRAFT_774695 [Paxillus ammoniavirescens]|nr:hypothetical protein BDN67DRAFT_774695 [Paxillus ammoniavirescens]
MLSQKRHWPVLSNTSVNVNVKHEHKQQARGKTTRVAVLSLVVCIVLNKIGDGCQAPFLLLWFQVPNLSSHIVWGNNQSQIHCGGAEIHYGSASIPHGLYVVGNFPLSCVAALRYSKTLMTTARRRCQLDVSYFDVPSSGHKVSHTPTKNPSTSR